MRSSLRPALLLVLLAVGVSHRSVAQRLTVGDPLEDYARLVSLLDSLPNPSFAVRPLSDSVWASVLERPNHPWAGRLGVDASHGWGLLPLSTRATVNSDYASGGNDGLMWQGKGLNTIVELGGTWRRGLLEVTLRPQLASSANWTFPLAPVIDSGRSDFANPWHPYNGKGGNIDLPQRMGDDTYTKFELGGSSVRVRHWGWAFGASDENLWWGPAQRNPLIFSNNAPAFAHGFLGTTRPVRLPGAQFEMRWIWGRLTNSGFSDSVPNDRTRYVTGLVAALQPDILPGLSVGGSRTYYMETPPGGIALKDLFLVVQGVTKKTQATDSNPSGDDLRDQFLTLFLRYTPPGSGFEVYFEWGRNDHSWDWRDFLMEPEHSAVSTVGAQKALRLRNGNVLRIAGEFTNLQRDLTQLVRATPSWYVHHKVRDGWTNEGQYLGAPIGTGSEAQTVWGDLYTKWGKVGILAGRVARDNDALYRIQAGTVFEDFEDHQVEVTLQASAMVFWRGLEWEGSFAWEKTFNRYFTYLNDHSNVHLELGARSRLPRW